MEHPIFHLELVVRNCRADASLNGFPVLSLDSAKGVPVSFAPPVNPYLCGARNQLEVTIRSVDLLGGIASKFGDASVTGSVRRFEPGGIVAPGTGTLVVEFGITDELRDRVREEELELPVSFSVPFANEAVDFSSELLDGPTFDDREAVLDYGMRLRGLLAAKDAGGLAAELAAKAAVWSQAYGEPVEEYRQDMLQSMQHLVSGRPVVDFDRGGLELTSCCGGRVWRIARPKGQPLLRSQLTEKSAHTLPVYVGPRDGALKIVR